MGARDEIRDSIGGVLAVLKLHDERGLLLCDEAEMALAQFEICYERRTQLLLGFTELVVMEGTRVEDGLGKAGALWGVSSFVATDIADTAAFGCR